MKPARAEVEGIESTSCSSEAITCYSLRRRLGMESAPAEHTGASDRALDAARRALWVFGTLGFVATVTGTLYYAYPETLRGLRPALRLMHEASGDLLIGAGTFYLVLHLRRTWRMWRRTLSRWTGTVALACLVLSSLTGLYGQLQVLADSSVWWAHVVSSIGLVVLACLHGAYGLRHRFIERR